MRLKREWDMFMRRLCAIVIASLALAGCVSTSSHAGSNHWYPKDAYGSDAYYGKSFKRSNVRCDKKRDICYDRYGISYHATMRFLGEREANRAYKKYGKQVLLFSPKRGVVCNRRTNSCTSERWVRNDHDHSFNRPSHSMEGFGAIGSSNDWRHRQQHQQYWPYDDD
jgi:hypothetical protein